jgi:serine phosphatase RsbU (regulator of sigma subunit)
MNQLDRSGQMLDEVHKLIPAEADYVGQTWLFYCAQLHLQKGEYQQALALNTKRMQLLEPDDDKALYLQIVGQRVEILRSMGRYEEATNISRDIIQVKDSVNGMETRNQLNEMNTLFKVDELKMEQERAQFRNTLIIVGLIVLALIVFTVFRIIAARRLKKAHNQLQETHEQLLTAYDQLEETTAAKERIESDLRIARNIQMGMVPSTFPERSDVDLYASMTPAKEVGGDLYGYYLSGDKLYFALGDVSGKGVPASLFMAQATRLFRTLAAQQLMPAQICTQINDALSGEDNETCMFVTMFVGLADLTTGHLDFCNAGHNPPVIGGGDSKGEFLKMEANAPIGLWPDLKYVGEEIDTIKGRPLFIYTDGLNEAENPQQEQFGDKRLLDILRNTHFDSAQQVVDTLKAEVEKHRNGAEPNDDLTMMCLRCVTQ